MTSQVHVPVEAFRDQLSSGNNVMNSRGKDVPGAESRLDFLDNARVFCMLLVVPYHAAHLYESQKDWWVHSSDNSIAFDLIISLQKSFCMSAFFLIAGFFSASVIQRKGLAPWAQSRVPRLVVPFIVAMLTIQIFQLEIIAKHEGAISSWQFWRDYLNDRGRINIFHLWFIPCLMILSAALGFAIKFWGQRIFIWDRSYPTSFLCIIAISVLIFIVGRTIPPLLPFRMSVAWQIFDFREALYYIAPFFIGAKLFWDERFRAGFLRFSKWTALAGFVAYVAVTATLHADRFAEKALRDFASPIAAICLSQVLIALCYRFLNSANSASRAVSRSAYSIYLFHHPIVFVLGIEFLRVNVNIYLEYAVVVIAATTLPFLIHHFLIARSSLLSFLFNGTPVALRSQARPKGQQL